MDLKASVRKSIELGMPLLINDLFRYLLYFIDTAMVGHLSSQAMTIAGLAGLSNGIMINILFGLSAGVQAVLTREVGRGEDGRRLHRLFAQFLVVGLICGVLFFALYHIAVPLLLEFSALKIPADAETFRAEATAYSHVLNYSTVVMAVFFVVHGYLASQRRMKSLALSGVAMAALNVVLNYLFIYRLGFGVLGAAYGTLLAQSSVLILVLIWTWPQWKEFGELARGEIARMLRFASWPGLQAALGMVSFFAFQSLCGWNGKEALAATIAALTVYRILKVVVTGFANGSSIHIGREIGGGQMANARMMLTASFALSAALALAAALVVVVFEGRIVRLFGGEVAGLPLVHAAIWFFAPVMILDALTVSLTIPLSKNGAGRRLFYSELITHALFTLALGFGLWRHTQLGVWAIWAGFALQVLAHFLVVQNYARRGTWIRG